MNKTVIEWCDYTINPVKGLCPMACPYCYARRMYKRFKWDATIRFEVPALIPPKHTRIFVGSTMELFGDWVNPQWLKSIFSMVEHHPDNTFIFLTKRPENLIRFSPFPGNCWVGCSATNSEQVVRAMTELDFIDASVKFLSLEPLLSNEGYTKWEYISVKKINWLIIGQQTPTSPTTKPRIEDIQQIIQGADNAGVPVFLKNNLKGFLPFRQYYNVDYHDKCYSLRQDFPKD